MKSIFRTMTILIFLTSCSLTENREKESNNTEGKKTEVTSKSVDNCQSYPLNHGMKITGSINSNLKIISTVSIPINKNKKILLIDLREQAELEATANIAGFFDKKITSNSDIERIVEESSRLNDEYTSDLVKERVNRIKKIRTQTSKRLTGLSVIGSCLTADTEIRVTVGWKEDNEKSSQKDRLNNREKKQTGYNDSENIRNF